MTSLTQTFKIRFNSSKNCFIAIPRSWARSLDNDVISVETLSQSVLYFNWSGEYSSSDECVEINGLFGTKLGLTHEETVIVTKFAGNTVKCRQCFVEPVSENDWEILNMNAEVIETNLMNQIRVVWSGLNFPIWLSQGICIYVRVSRMSPDKECALLEEMTEVVVVPPGSQPPPESNDVNHATPKRDLEPLNQSSLVNTMFSSFTTYFAKPEKDKQPATNIVDFIYSIDYTREGIPLRVLPLKVIPESANYESVWNTVFVNPEQFKCDSTKLFAKMIALLSPSERLTKMSANSQGKPKPEDENYDCLRDEKFYISTYVTVVPLNGVAQNNIVPCDTLRRQLGLPISSLVILEKSEHEETAKLIPGKSPKATKKIPVASSVLLRPLVLTNKSTESIARNISSYLDTHEFLLCANGTLINVYGEDFLIESDGYACFLLKKTIFDTDSDVKVGKPLIQLVKTSWGTFLPFRTIKELDSKVNLKSTATPPLLLGGVTDIYGRLKSLLYSYLDLCIIPNDSHLRPKHRGCILLTGPKGSGKTTLIKQLTTNLANPPHFTYVKEIDCKLWRGRRIDSIKKDLSRAVAEAYHRQPSVIVLKDLDILIPAPAKPEEEIGVEALQYFRLTNLLVYYSTLLEDKLLTLGSKVVLFATSKSKTSLNQALVEARGRHFFSQVIELLPLDVDQRIESLFAILANKPLVKKSCLESLNMKEIARRVEGFLPLDLNMLVERAVHHCLVRLNSANQLTNVDLIQEDFEEALTNFTPLALRGANLKIKSTKSLRDVGGHSEIKQNLLETILWPAKYPHLFSKCGLRPQSCMLIFGAPGTGKTLLAEALANECNLNFISVEGPELLSKYIGASEQAVRDLFNRAKSAKPCILFFDEFDSIAPRRGHDSTGVTDRVVNQLLTQMDGVEALDRGVFILAATSRPDLLDPALLRPGRFDKCLHCSLPNESERRDILTVLSDKLHFEDDVNLDLISASTEYFTGADLQAILYSAQIEALHESIDMKKKTRDLEAVAQNEELPGDKRAKIYHMPVKKKKESGMGDRSIRPEGEGPASSLKDESAMHAGGDGSVIERNVLQPRPSSRNVDDEEEEDESSEEDEALVAASPAGYVRIAARHISAALNNAKPSVSLAERRKYSAIYAAFVKSRGNDFLGEASKATAKKVTLA